MIKQKKSVLRYYILHENMFSHNAKLQKCHILINIKCVMFK